MSQGTNPIERWLRDCLHVECGGDPELLERLGSELRDKNSRALVVAFARDMRRLLTMMPKGRTPP